VPFTQGGANASCVIVHFSALAYARTTTMFVRARIGRIDAIPAVMQLTGDDDENLQGGAARARSVIFIFPSIAPGDHTLRIEYRSGQNGNRVWIHNHTTLVQFAP
jgi:hypothetical protein